MAAQEDNHDMPTWARTDRSAEQAFTFQWPPQATSFPPQPEHNLPSFFEDCLAYHPEEATLFNPTQSYLAPLSGPLPMDTLTMPYTPAAPTSATANVRKSDVDAATRYVQTNVDTAQFEQIRNADWRKASIDLGLEDEYATSPASTESSGQGPYTPANLNGEAGSSEAANPFLDGFDYEANANLFEDVDVVGHKFADEDRSFPEGLHGLSLENRRRLPLGSMFAGLPIAPGAVHQQYSNNGMAATGHGSFRTADGLPTEVAVPSRKRKQRRTTQAQDADAEAGSDRTERDQLLLNMRASGQTYKAIKDLGDFHEAESTLRGRVRVLTRPRSQRVRKPEWSEDDVCLLRVAVALHRRAGAKGTYKRRRGDKFPWKLIAKHINDNGGSYHFAPATCAKKWDQVC